MSLLDNASLLLTPNAYKEGKLYSVIPSNGNGDFTATRATTATRVNSAGLVDLVPYNLFNWSEMFSDALWTKTASTISSNTITAPNGTLTADTLSIGIDAAAARHRMFQLKGFETGTTYTYSVYLKQNQFRWVQIVSQAAFNAAAWCSFDLQDGVIGNNGGGFTTQTITSAGNGWWRISVTATAISTANSDIDIVVPTDGTNTSRYPSWQSLSAVDCYYVWGAQLVEGTSARDYLRTETRLNIPRIDYSLAGCPNILLEPQRTNSVLNSSMVGAVAGSPGTAPTGWAFNGGGGLTRTISLGTENGLPYIDFRFQGTAIQTFLTILPTPSSTSASATQNWNFSLYAKLVSGTLPSPRLNILASGGTAQTQVITLTSSLQRFDTTFLNLPVGTTNVRPYLDSNTLSIGTAYDFTIRIAAPQLEQGAYATSFIPTTTASVTRNADTITRNNIFTNGLITASGGTWFVELRNNRVLTRDGFQTGLSLDDNAFLNSIRITNAGTQRVSIFLNWGGTSSTAFTTTADNCKLALKFNGSTLDIFQNGVKVVNATTFAPNISLMQSLRVNPNGIPYFINQMALFPTPLTDDQLIELTTL